MTTCESCGIRLAMTQSAGSPALALNRQDDIRRRLQETDWQVARFHALLQKRTSLENELNNYTSSPVLRLPPEITIKIVLQCIPTTNSKTTSDGSKPLTPFQLGHVCRAWRRVVWSSPSLWSTIFFNTDVLRNTWLLAVWLEQSASLPLSIFIRGSWSSADRAKSCLQSLLVLQNGFHRLVSLSLENLRHTPGWGQSIDFFSSASQLRSIHLSGLLMDLFVLPLQQVTRFSLAFSSISNCLRIVARSPCVTHCILANIPEMPDTVAPRAISAPCLQSLTLDNVSPIRELLDHLTSPTLRDLVVMGTSVPFQTLISFIARSSCSLERLSIAGAQIQGSQLLECLWLTPSIVELSLSSKNLGNEIVRLLDPSPKDGSSNCFLPNLQVLEYHGDFDINNLAITDMSLARQRGSFAGIVAQLRRLMLRTNQLSSPDTQVTSGYRELVSEGLYLSVETDKEKWI